MCTRNNCLQAFHYCWSHSFKVLPSCSEDVLMYCFCPQIFCGGEPNNHQASQFPYEASPLPPAQEQGSSRMPTGSQPGPQRLVLDTLLKLGIRKIIIITLFCEIFYFHLHHSIQRCEPGADHPSRRSHKITDISWQKSTLLRAKADEKKKKIETEARRRNCLRSLGCSY